METINWQTEMQTGGAGSSASACASQKRLSTLVSYSKCLRLSVMGRLAAVRAG